MSKPSGKQLSVMTKAQLLALPSSPEFNKASLRVLEGDGFASYDAAVNGATVVASKEALADHLFNGIAGYALEGRVRDIAGATARDMEAALVSDFYVVNNVDESFVKCTGKDVAEILKEAVKRGQQCTTALKDQSGFGGSKDLTLRPITEYNAGGKFQRYLTNLKHKRDEDTMRKVNDLLLLKSFKVKELFEFSKQIAIARYYNISSDLLDAFEKEAAAKKLNKATGGFF